MNVSNLPTDNLYKFGTVASVVLICFSFWHEETMRSEIGISVAGNEARSIVLKKQASEIRKMAEENHTIPENYFDHTSKIDLERVNIEASIRLIEERVAELSVSSKVDRFKLDNLQRLSSAYFWLRLAAISSFICGIFFWYLNHQRFQDQIARAEAAKGVGPV